GVGVDDEARGRDARGAERLQRLLQPAAGRRAARVLVDDVALARLVDGHEHVPLGSHACTSSPCWTRSPLKTPCRAPGTPYSYGLPTTCGISSKLKIGGGELTCHSSVSERHGLAGAFAPKRQLVIML